jgi:hypothetical protein
MNKTTVIHHSADFDGIFCREIAKKFLPDAKLIGWDYGQQVPAIEKGTKLYMLDISIDGLMGFPGLVWIDHHKSAIDKYPGTIDGWRIDGVAACRLAWIWFAHLVPETGDSNPYWERPDKQMFIDRSLPEPLAVRLAGEYDIWDKRDSNAELFQHGLRSQDINETEWLVLLSEGFYAQEFVVKLLEQGRCLQYSQTKQNESIIKDIGFDLEWEGLKFKACNHARYNSFLFTAGLTPEHDACFGFKWTGKDWSVSLYHAPGKEHHDLSKIAVKYGGGGHRGACGFRMKKLPFLT